MIAAIARADRASKRASGSGVEGTLVGRVEGGDSLFVGFLILAPFARNKEEGNRNQHHESTSAGGTSNDRYVRLWLIGRSSVVRNNSRSRSRTSTRQYQKRP